MYRLAKGIGCVTLLVQQQLLKPKMNPAESNICCCSDQGEADNGVLSIVLNITYWLGFGCSETISQNCKWHKTLELYWTVMGMIIKLWKTQTVWLDGWMDCRRNLMLENAKRYLFGRNNEKVQYRFQKAYKNGDIKGVMWKVRGRL